VILLGRLCLYGPDAARLHEEIVSVTARWIEPSQRKGALKTFARDAEAKTLDLLEQSLLAKNSLRVEETILKRLRDAGPRDVEELLTHLSARGNDLADEAAGKLVERGEKEAGAMKEILNDQKARLTAVARKYSDPQLSFDFDIEEKRQLDANRRHWEKRLTAIDREMEKEPERIRGLYQIKAKRLEPIGLAYLWPITG
jgi:hypothetical protein